MRHFRLLVFGLAVALFALGGWGLPGAVAGWLTVSAAAGFFAALLVLVATGRWSAPLAWGLAGLLVLGLGGLLGPVLVDGVRVGVASLAGLEFEFEWALLLLALIPFLFIVGARNLGFLDATPRERRWLTSLTVAAFLLPPVGLPWLVVYLRRLSGRVPGLARRWVAVGLRSGVVLALTLALAGPSLAVPHDRLTVLFVLDRSLSVPEEPAGDGQDLRWLRVRDFMNEAVARRPAGHERDQVGLIVFGRQPRLELLPGDAPRFNLTEITSALDGKATDVAAALQLALAVFPEGSARRVVLISDGNENRGNALEQATLARLAGVQIDVLPLAVGKRPENEVIVERLEVPRQVERFATLPIKVWVRSYSPRPVRGRLVVRQMTEAGTTVVPDPEPVKVLQLGLNFFTLPQPLGGEVESYTYEAEFQPEGIADDNGRLVVRGLAGDRVQNNRATAHVVARGRRRVLLLEAEAGQHRELVRLLRAEGRSRFQIDDRPVDVLAQFPDRERLTAWLANFDSVILSNIPADKITPEQQEAIRANTHDQGCGLIMVGGPDAFGAGGWQNTPVEKALPVDADIKSTELEEKSGLVLVMHASEMAEGNMWQKKIAKLAIERLSPRDELGVLRYGFNMEWYVPLQEVGVSRAPLFREIDRLEPGDMPDFDPALRMAHEKLTEKQRQLAVRHVIIISDGDPLQQDGVILGKMRADKVTVTTVGVATHDLPQDKHLEKIAKATGGRYYNVKKPTDLPAIYIRETRLVSRSFVNEKPFEPLLRFRSGPTTGLDPRLPPLRGFVRTTPKPGPLVEVSINTPREGDLDYPVLATWTYGLGKAAAFTSDAGRPKLWCQDWAGTPVFARFWEQLIDWSVRPVEDRNLTLTADHREGRITVAVEARTDAGDADLYLQDLRAEVTPPWAGPDAPRKPELRFEQKSGGVYEAEFQAEEAGSYFIAFQATRKTKRDDKEADERVSIRGSVTLPYAAEFGDLESHPEQLRRIAAETGGTVYEDDAAALAEVAQSGTVFRPVRSDFGPPRSVWYWLLFAAGLLLLLDIAVRRIAFERLGWTMPLRRLWARLRHREAPAEAPAFLARLQTRKAQVGEQLERTVADRRFEPTSTDSPAVTPESPTATTTQAPAPPTPPVAPEEPGEPGDYASRLLRAKKRVWEERKGDQQ